MHWKMVKFASENDRKMRGLEEKIWQAISEVHAPGFFITAEMGKKGSCFPTGLIRFVEQKLNLIRAGLSVRRFVFQEDGWRIYLTFFPTTEVVDEKYALKNKVLSREYK